MENEEEIPTLRGRPLIPVTSKEEKYLNRRKCKVIIIVIVIVILIIIIIIAMVIINMPPNSDHAHNHN